MTKVRPCTKCGCPVWWDDTVKNPSPKPKKEWGWWREDLTKEIHWNRCEVYKKQVTGIPKLDDKLSNLETISDKIHFVNANNFEFIHLQEEEQESIHVQARELYEILQVIKLELTEEQNPAVIGMIFNAVVNKLSRGKKDE